MYKESCKPVTKDIGPKDADAFLRLEKLEGEREPELELCRVYADNMEKGFQRRVEIAIAKLKGTPRMFRVNGQHNCHAIILLGKSYPASIAYYDCDTMIDVWNLFATFDVGKNRTAAQFMNARRPLFKDKRLHDVPKKVLTSCGVSLYRLGTTGCTPIFVSSSGLIAKTAMANMVDKHPDEVVFVSQYSGEKHMMCNSIVTAMIATYRKNPERSQEFWDKVATGDMLEHDDPRKKLRDALKGFSSTNRILKDSRGKVRDEALFSTCVIWWNAWRTNENRKVVNLGALKGKLPKICDEPVADNTKAA